MSPFEDWNVDSGRFMGMPEPEMVPFKTQKTQK